MIKIMIQLSNKSNNNNYKSVVLIAKTLYLSIKFLKLNYWHAVCLAIKN